MREILFRGKRTDNGTWIEGNYCIAEKLDKSGVEYFIIEIEAEGSQYYVIPETVGQYTGLTDKNGKRIFEGDIVKDAGSYISVIKIGCCLPSEFYEIFDFEIFNKNNLKICAVYAEHVFGEYKGEHFLLPEKNSTIVIGNIHDNPELLEVQEQ